MRIGHPAQQEAATPAPAPAGDKAALLSERRLDISDRGAGRRCGRDGGREMAGLDVADLVDTPVGR